MCAPGTLCFLLIAYTYEHTYTYAHIRTDIHMRTCTNTNIHTYTHEHTHTHLTILSIQRMRILSHHGPTESGTGWPR